MKPNLKAAILKARTVDGIVYFYLSDGTYWMCSTKSLFDRDYKHFEKLAGCPKVLE